MLNKRLGLDCVDMESGESVKNSKVNSRVIWLAWGRVQGAGMTKLL